MIAEFIKDVQSYRKQEEALASQCDNIIIRLGELVKKKGCGVRMGDDMRTSLHIFGDVISIFINKRLKICFEAIDYWLSMACVQWPIADGPMNTHDILVVTLEKNRPDIDQRWRWSYMSAEAKVQVLEHIINNMDEEFKKDEIWQK